MAKYRFSLRMPFLARVFPPAPGSGILQPQFIENDQVVLTHDFIGTAPYSGVSIYDAIGAADVVSVPQVPRTPSDQVWIVDELNVRTTDAVNRVMTLILHYVNAAGDFGIIVMKQDSGSTASQWWPLGRRLIIPPNGYLELVVPALTAGASLRWTMAFLALAIGQFCPKT